MKINVDCEERQKKKEKEKHKKRERIYFLDNSALRGVCRSDMTRRHHLEGHGGCRLRCTRQLCLPQIQTALDPPSAICRCVSTTPTWANLKSCRIGVGVPFFFKPHADDARRRFRGTIILSTDDKTTQGVVR